MNEAFQFFDRHTFLAFIAILGVVHVIAMPVRLFGRLVRHLNIRSQGWPPAHLDADGDAIDREDEKS